MNDSPEDYELPQPCDHDCNDSRDCMDIAIDVVWEWNPRPLTGKDLEHAMREREKLVRAGLLPPLPEPENKPGTS